MDPITCVREYVTERLKPCNYCFYPSKLCESAMDLYDFLTCYTWMKSRECNNDLLNIKIAPMICRHEVYDDAEMFRTVVDQLVIRAVLELGCYPFYWKTLSTYTRRILDKACEYKVDLDHEGMQYGNGVFVFREHFILMHDEVGFRSKDIAIFPMDADRINSIYDMTHIRWMCDRILGLSKCRHVQLPEKVKYVIGRYIGLCDLHENVVRGW